MIPELARLAGVADRYTDFYGNVRTVSTESITAVLRAMGYPITTDAEAADAIERMRSGEDQLQPVYVIHAGERLEIDCGARAGAIEWTLEPERGESENGISERWIRIDRAIEAGYYTLRVNDATTTVIAAPPAAYVPPELESRKLWGLAAQLYSLRSSTDWGIGDFGCLGRLLDIGSRRGAACVAVNPLHQLHLTNPTSASPYSPLSRLYLNALYIDVDAAHASIGGGRVAPSAGALRRLRAAELVDYAGVAREKLRALRALHARFRKARKDSSLAAQFARFVYEGGTRLHRFALYEALMDEFKRRDEATWGWMQWPIEYRNPGAPLVNEFANSHETEIEFQEFLQWLADRQLADAVKNSGTMAIGLYRDLAVGVDANSADVWADPRAFCLNLGVGAPPDPMNVLGQNWLLPPLNPRVLRERAYAPFIALLRANMRHAGTLRIDHVMGLMRLFCIPRDVPASEGTYVSYRFDEMLGVLALESARHRCAIVGEDLGTVPPGFRERLTNSRIMGCRVLYFEREQDGSFRAPADYTPAAVASAGTHDLPPFAGFWSGTDIEQRRELGFTARIAEAEAERALSRRFLLGMLETHGNLGRNEASRLQDAAGGLTDEALTSLIRAAYRALGRSAARLLLVQLEDTLLERHQVNTPGTFDEVPNWKRKLSMTLAELESNPRFLSVLADVDAARRKGA
jgi:4-alpha-glucanotransferase